MKNDEARRRACVRARPQPLDTHCRYVAGAQPLPPPLGGSAHQLGLHQGELTAHHDGPILHLSVCARGGGGMERMVSAVSTNKVGAGGRAR